MSFHFTKQLYSFTNMKKKKTNMIINKYSNCNHNFYHITLSLLFKVQPIHKSFILYMCNITFLYFNVI